MSYQTKSAVAGGEIRICRFVKVSAAADHTILEADANEAIIGISTDTAQNAPIPSASVSAATAAGEQCKYHPIGDICLLHIGSGGVTRAGELKSDADGKGVARATTGTTLQNVGAIAWESAIEDDLALVQIHRTSLYPALA